MGSLRRHRISFQNAFSGWRWAVSTQPNFRFHLIAALAALFTAWYLKVSLEKFLFIFSAIFVVMITELINTSLEAATDLLAEGRWSSCAKVAKDVAAAAVLTAAALAVLVGVLIFLPLLKSRFLAS